MNNSSVVHQNNIDFEFISENLLSPSLWTEFFGDRVGGSVQSDLLIHSTYKFKIERPVYVVPMMAFHVNHIFIDLMNEVKYELPIHHRY